MDKAKVEKWLNRITKATMQLAKIKDFSDELGWCDAGVTHTLNHKPYIQLSKGIFEIGEMFGIEVVQYDEGDKYRYYRIEWNGVDVVQLEEKEK